MTAESIAPQPTTPGTEAAAKADFTRIRYGQCWEDADILLDALGIQDGDTCLSIASAGDNSFSLLTKNPARVIGIDLNPAQIACCGLRKAAYIQLEHPELLQLIGATASENRARLYQRCRPELTDKDREFWDARPELIAWGIGSAGKFEKYFALFRTRVLPWIHSRVQVDSLLAGGTPDQRREFYDTEWNNWRWRLLFKLFFSRTIMGKLGRDPAFFQYVEGNVSTRILARSKYALTELNPAENPYLQWILTGRFDNALPHALRPENFDCIRRNIDRINFHLCSIEQYLSSRPAEKVNRFNLSDIFEYMSEQNCQRLLELMVQHSNAGGRLVYWNMLVPRCAPPTMEKCLKSLNDLAERLFLRDKAFFYSRLVVEEVV